jgi:hypothetical protein
VPVDDATFDTLESVGEAAQGAGLVAGGGSALTGFILGASLNLMYGILHMVQMYVHFPLFHLILPGNLFGILKIFINIATLDLLTSETMFSATFDYNPMYGMSEYNDRFGLLGYDTQSVVYNLGDLSVLQFWVFFKLGFLLAYIIMAKANCSLCCTTRN